MLKTLPLEYNNSLKRIYEFISNNIFDLSFFSYDNIYYTDNIKEDALLFYKNPTIEIKKNTEGITILPNEIIKDIIILINISSNDVLIYALNMVHELIHTYDLNAFAYKYTYNDLRKIQHHHLYLTYVEWSEVKAYSLANFYVYYIVDTYSNENYTDQWIQKRKKVLKESLLELRKELLTNSISSHELSTILGMIHSLDCYYSVPNISKSFAYEYLPILFDEKYLEQIYSLYSLYFDSIKNNRIWENLQEIQMIEKSLHKKK